MRKVTTQITKANEGMHSAREFRKAKKMLEECAYINARLYHICFQECDQIATYQAALKALCSELRRRKMPCQYKGCFEDESKKEKGFHMHVYLLVESHYANPDVLLNRKPDGWLTTMATKHDLSFDINHPRDPIHRKADGKQKLYATLPKTKPEKLADCIEWISYLYKARSKIDLDQTYFGSRPSRAKIKSDVALCDS